MDKLIEAVNHFRDERNWCPFHQAKDLYFDFDEQILSKLAENNEKYPIKESRIYDD